VAVAESCPSGAQTVRNFDLLLACAAQSDDVRVRRQPVGQVSAGRLAAARWSGFPLSRPYRIVTLCRLAGTHYHAGRIRDLPPGENARARGTPAASL